MTIIDIIKKKQSGEFLTPLEHTVLYKARNVDMRHKGELLKIRDCFTNNTWDELYDTNPKIEISEEDFMKHFPVGTRKPLPSLDLLDQHIRNMTEDDWDKYFPDRHKKQVEEWVNIEDELPVVRCCDIGRNEAFLARVVKVKDINGKEFHSQVGDHLMWYYMAKENGITHWYRELEPEEPEKTIVIL